MSRPQHAADAPLTNMLADLEYWTELRTRIVATDDVLSSADALDAVSLLQGLVRLGIAQPSMPIARALRAVEEVSE